MTHFLRNGLKQSNKSSETSVSTFLFFNVYIFLINLEQEVVIIEMSNFKIKNTLYRRFIQSLRLTGTILILGASPCGRFSNQRDKQKVLCGIFGPMADSFRPRVTVIGQKFRNFLLIA